MHITEACLTSTTSLAFDRGSIAPLAFADDMARPPSGRNRLARQQQDAVQRV
jgi:hypothetical protein